MIPRADSARTKYNMSFRLHKEGSKQNPSWGIAFRDRINDPYAALDSNDKLSIICIQFFDGPKYEIR